MPKSPDEKREITPGGRNPAPPRRSLPETAIRYGTAVLAVFVATLLRFALGSTLDTTQAPFLTFFLAVVIAAWIGGMGPAILCVCLSALSADYFFIAPVGAFSFTTPGTLWSLALFVLTGLGIATIGELQRQAASRSRESERRVLVTLRSIGDGVLVTDRDGRITMMNPVAQKMTGWTETEARGKLHTEVFHVAREGNGKPVESPVDRVLREGTTVNAPSYTILTARDGSQRSIADSGAPIRDEDGAVRGSVLVFRDVTREQRAEKRARFLLRLNERTRSQSRPENVLKETVDGIGEYLSVARCLYAEVVEAADMVVVRRDYCHGVGSMVGTHQLSQWGEIAEMIVGQEPLVFEDTREDPRTASVYETVYAPLSIRAALTVPLHKDGKLVAVLSAHGTKPRQWTSEDSRLLSEVLEDTWLTLENSRLYQSAQEEIVVRRKAEADRERSLVEVRALNERLRYAMSETHHRVKNNLQVISGLVSMHLTGEEKPIPAQALHQLNHHIRSLAAIHDILTMQARTDGSTQEISVRQTIQRMEPILQAMTDGRPITFEIDDCPLPIRQTTTLAVLVNELVSNALKHGRGTVAVRFACRENAAVLSVSDEGPGFSDTFDAKTAANTGLELVENLVQWDLQGNVSYENVEAEPGGRVVITFPMPHV